MKSSNGPSTGITLIVQCARQGDQEQEWGLLSVAGQAATQSASVKTLKSLPSPVDVALAIERQVQAIVFTETLRGLVRWSVS
jgi:hypothetical protein